MSSGPGARPSPRSVRYRLLVIALVPLLVVLPVLLGISVWNWAQALDELKVSKATNNLTIALQYLEKLTSEVLSSAVAVSESYPFHEALSAGDVSALSDLLRAAANRRDFDFLYLTDAQGRLLAQSIGEAGTALRSDWPIIEAALAGNAQAGLDILTSKDLAAIAPALAERALVELAPDTASDGLSVESRGLVLRSAVGVTLPDGRRAALVAGILLNNDFTFVDRISDLVFQGSGLLAGSVGVVTLSVGDVRISTNARMPGGQRAVGTHVAKNVRRAVLDEGKVWLGSAPVFNEQFVSGYAPLYDSFGQRVGMLHVGYLEKPITDTKTRAVFWTLFALVIATTTTVPVLLLWAARIFRPLERIDDTIMRIENGELDARTNANNATDEIGRVAQRLDKLLDQVQEREASLRQLNGQLREVSEQRAAALREKSSELQTTIEHLVMSEKLATIGQITASIAHEINNPVAIMQGNLELLCNQLGPAASGVGTELDLLDQQLRRMKEIIDRLLLFAKPHEYAGEGPASPGAIIAETMPFVRHVIQKAGVELQIDDHSGRTAEINRVELQQVLVNLIINATQAMPRGGALDIRTFDEDRDGVAGVAVEIADTGMGMAPEVLRRVFEPFFTTRGAEGNGLGLSISRMLVERQGGQLTVRSVEGEGSAFTVWFPATG